jgi:Ca2+-binding RTX toxin-like protein
VTLLTFSNVAAASFAEANLGYVLPSVIGTSGNDTAGGSPRNDFFNLQQGGNDSVSGLEGQDSFFFGAALTSADKVDGGAGTDTLALQGDYATKPLTFGAGLVGIELIALMPGNDTRYGAPGTALYSYDITVVQENAAPGVQVRIDAARLRAGENFTFDSSAETDGWYRIAGGAGVDDLTTGSRSDSFHFTAATWGAGDRIDAGAGNDQLGLQGNFTIAFGEAQLTGIEILALLSGRDMRENVDYNYAITSADGNVAAGQRLGVDAARLRAGETLMFDGSAEQDGFFRMAGGEGGDALTGGRGNDVIEGGGGADALRGNAGADTFLYRDAAHSTVAASDTVLDLTLGDLIGLSGIDADAAAAGDQAFAFIGSAAFTGQAGQLRAEQSGTRPGTWTVQGDTDGNGAADFQLFVTVTDSHALTTADFVL